MKKDTLLQLFFACLIVCTSALQNYTDIGGTTPPPKGGGPTVIPTGKPFNPGRIH